MTLEGPFGRDPGLVPALAAGAALGPYRVEKRIGAGGMGEVYRAIDTRLERAVALKVLAPALAHDPQFRLRFEREARVLATLSHPHIGAIYGLETSGDVCALVLELVEGPTLAERIELGRLQPIEALRIARQIATALEAAHSKGIVHRDLKPANVKIASDGTVKILDFGIAKAIEGIDASATRTAGPTEEGAVIGTRAYMSPEQLRGGAVDKRADIWAFGCLLYELLTGRHAFAGATTPDIIARIVDREPDWEALPADVPGSIRTLLRRCLRKDPVDRLHDVADARLELSDALAAPGEIAPKTAALPHKERIWWVAALVLVSTAAVAGWFGWRRLAEPAPAGVPLEFGLRFPPEHRPSTGVAVSPDGRSIVAGLFGKTQQIWLTSLDSSESQALPGTEGGTLPFWSADGSQIAFFRQGKLRRIARSGGPITDICEMPFADIGTWSADDVILFASSRDLMQVRGSGGTPSVVKLAVEPEIVRLTFPQFLPDNRHFLFYARRADGSESLRIGSLDSGQTTEVGAAPSFAKFAKPNYLLFVRGASLVAQPFDLKTFQLVGTESVLVPSVLSGTVHLGPSFSASETVLVFGAPFSGEPGQLKWFDQTSAGQESISPPAAGEYLNPSISPDGGSVAMNGMEPQTGNWDIWIWNRARGFASRLTSDQAMDTDAIWSTDGKHVVFTSNRSGRPGFYRRAVDGSGTDETLVTLEGSVVMGDWSRDGQHILYSHRFGVSGYSVWAVPLVGDRKPVQLIGETYQPYAPRLSPDGQWLAYTDLSTGSLEVHVRRFMADGVQAQISHGGGIHPRWIANGRGLTFAKIGGGVAAVDLEFGASGIRVGAERILMPLPVATLNDSRSHYDVTRDGRRLLVRVAAGPSRAPYTVVVNWTARLR